MKLARQSWPNCSLASFSRWEPINYGIIEQSCACHLVSDDELKIVSEIDKYMGKVDPKILFVHLDLVDDAGHSFGYWTNEFYRSIQTADYLVGQIIDTICRQRLDNGSLIIACSDHGGGGCAPNEHGCDDPKDMTIFWGCMSPSRKVGAVINSDMSITDTAAVVVSALGLERPREWDAVVPRPLINHGLI